MVIQGLPAPLVRVRAWIDAKVSAVLARSWGRRLDPYLGFSDLRRWDPLLVLVPMAVFLVFGLRRSTFGHIDTVPAIFPIMSLVSGLSPVTGFLCALAYGAGDLLQKFVTDDVFYEGVRTAGDYWGARIGYVIAYSSLIIFGVLPGAMSRVGRRIALKVAAGQRGSLGGPPEVGALTAGASIVAGMVGAVLGGIAGTLGAAVAFKGAVAPAFLLRPSPDHSCYALSGSNVVGSIPRAGIAGALGGGVAASPPVLGAPIPPRLEAGSNFNIDKLAAPSPVAGISLPHAPPVTGPVPSGGGPPIAPPGDSGAGGGGTTAPAPAGSSAPTASGTGTSTPGGGPTEEVVVSGPEAVDQLVKAGLTPVTHGGKVFVKPPASLPPGVSGIGHGPTITLPTGEVVIDPGNVAIVQQVPKPAGPTTSVTGGPATNALINEGFPTVTDPGTGEVFVRHPVNLIHGNVTGIAVQGTKKVNGVEVIDPTKGVVVLQTGPPSVPPVTTTTPPVVSTPTTPGPGTATAPSQPPVVTPQPPTVTPSQPPQPPPTPEVKVETQPPPPPPDPPRVPKDAATLKDSLTRPGTTVLTPNNLPGFAPDVLTNDGRIKVHPKAPDAIKKLEGIKAPTPTIKDETVSMDLPLNLGTVKVGLRVQDGRLVGDTSTSGGIAVIEGASDMFSDGESAIDVGKSVQSRIDRYNKMISDAKLEVKSVKADGGTLQVVTGPKP